MKKLFQYIVLLFFVLSFLSSSYSQETHNKLLISGASGIQYALGDFSNKLNGAASHGFSWGGNIIYSMSKNLDFYFSYNYRNFSADLDRNDLDTYWKINNFSIGGKIYIINKKHRPFILLGTGLYKPTAITKSKSLKISVAGNNNIGLNLGVGVSFETFSNFYFQPCFLFYHFSDNKYDKMNFNFFECKLEIVYLLTSF